MKHSCKGDAVLFALRSYRAAEDVASEGITSARHSSWSHARTVLQECVQSHDNFIEWYESEKQRIAEELSRGAAPDGGADTSVDALALKLITDVKAALTATQTGMFMLHCLQQRC